jgi:hypothetical protein
MTGVCGSQFAGMPKRPRSMLRDCCYGKKHIVSLTLDIDKKMEREEA